MDRLHKGNYMSIQFYTTDEGSKYLWKSVGTDPELEDQFMELNHFLVGKGEDTIGLTSEGLSLLNEYNIHLPDEYLIPESGYETTRGNYTWEEDLVTQ